jgi:hypothetical protein
MRPYDKTVTHRRDAINKARSALTVARQLTTRPADADPMSQNVRVTRLLWARAWVDRALALETRGVLGDREATPTRYLAAAGLTMTDVVGDDACGATDLTTGRRCTRGAGHPGAHADKPNGAEW